MRVQFLGHSLFAVYLGKHKSDTAQDLPNDCHTAVHRGKKYGCSTTLQKQVNEYLEKKRKRRRKGLCWRHMCATCLLQPRSMIKNNLIHYKTQIKEIYIMVKEGWICRVTFTYIYLCCTSIFMNILDNSITPALFWIIPEVDLPLEWYLCWNRTHPASNYNRLGVWARFGFIKQWTERGKNAKLDFFFPFNIYI